MTPRSVLILLFVLIQPHCIARLARIARRQKPRRRHGPTPRHARRTAIMRMQGGTAKAPAGARSPTPAASCRSKNGAHFQHGNDTARMGGTGAASQGNGNAMMGAAMADRDENGRYLPAHTQPGPGRDTLYHDDMPEQARKLALLGMTDQQIAEFFEVSHTTLYAWTQRYPAFLEAPPIAGGPWRMPRSPTASIGARSA